MSEDEFIPFHNSYLHSFPQTGQQNKKDADFSAPFFWIDSDLEFFAQNFKGTLWSTANRA